MFRKETCSQPMTLAGRDIPQSDVRGRRVHTPPSRPGQGSGLSRAREPRPSQLTPGTCARDPVEGAGTGTHGEGAAGGPWRPGPAWGSCLQSCPGHGSCWAQWRRLGPQPDTISSWRDPCTPCLSLLSHFEYKAGALLPGNTRPLPEVWPGSIFSVMGEDVVPRVRRWRELLPATLRWSLLWAGASACATGSFLLPQASCPAPGTSPSRQGPCPPGPQPCPGGFSLASWSPTGSLPSPELEARRGRGISRDAGPAGAAQAALHRPGLGIA